MFKSFMVCTCRPSFRGVLSLDVVIVVVVVFCECGAEGRKNGIHEKCQNKTTFRQVACSFYSIYLLCVLGRSHRCILVSFVFFFVVYCISSNWSIENCLHITIDIFSISKCRICSYSISFTFERRQINDTICFSLFVVADASSIMLFCFIIIVYCCFLLSH